MIDFNRNQRFHRLADVRKRERVSLQRVSAELGVPVAQLKRQELESCDVPLSVIYAWQKVLNVPIVELLIDADENYRSAVWDRARLVKMMKTVGSILEQSEQKGIQRLAENLRQELLQVMPELKEVKPWPLVGVRRSLDDLGRIAQDTVPDDLVWE